MCDSVWGTQWKRLGIKNANSYFEQEKEKN